MRKLLDKLSLYNSSPWVKRSLIIGCTLIALYAGYRFATSFTPTPPVIYKIGIDPSWYSTHFYTKNHAVTAFTEDLLTEIGQDQKMKIELLRVGPKCLFDFLDDEKFDGALSSKIPIGNGGDPYAYSDPFYRYGAVLVVPKDSDITTVLSLDKKRVGVKKGSPILFRLKVDPLINIVPYQNVIVAFQDLINDELDAVVVDQLFTYLYFKGPFQDKIKVVTQPLSPEGLRLVALKDHDSEMIEQFNQGLENIKRNGIYAKLLERWDLSDPENP